MAPADASSAQEPSDAEAKSDEQSAPATPSQGSPVRTPSDPASSSSSSPASPAQTPRRVKLYRLKDDQWLDLGTGNCAGILVEGASHDEGAWIVVSKEGSPAEGASSELLRSRVECSGFLSDEDEDEPEEDKVCNVGVYQKQQDTLIVWTDKATEMEMALSFATTGGCAEIWQFIKHSRKWQADQNQRSPSLSPGVLSPQPFPFYNPVISRLPELSLATIEQVENAIRSLGKTAVGRERTASAIIKGEFVQRLIEIQVEAEDLESLDDLHALCRVMQTILLLNDNAIFDLILRDEMILGVASVLEYDPEFPTMKASYRAHLSDPSHFTQVVPIRSPNLLAKIHQTHRLHYLKDVVLARILEDSTFSMLNSAIYFNEVDIVNEVAGDVVFLRELFGIFDDDEDVPGDGAKEEVGMIGPQLPPSEAPLIGPQRPPPGSPANSSHPDSIGELSMDIDTTTLGSSFDVDAIPAAANGHSVSSPVAGAPPLPDRRHDAILFLQQFCSMAKNLQLPLRAAFFRNLADKGLLRVIEVALSRTVTREDPIMKSATIEILMNLVDHDPNNVRGYSLKQQAADKRPLVVFLIELFHKEEDLGLKAQMADALRVLVDAGGEGGPLGAPPRARQEDPEAEKFLDYFYKNCILQLLAPILDLSDDSPLDISLHDVALCGHLCDLLCFFVSHHSFRSKYFVLSSPVSKNVAKLFKTRHKHLRLAALRYFRSCIGKQDDFHNRFLMKHDLLTPILDLAVAEMDKDNLLASACLEFFEFIRTNNAKAIVSHLMELHGDKIRLLAPTLKPFAALIIRWEQNNEPPPAKVDAAVSAATSKSMKREGGSWTRMDMEEESYFDGSDDEEDSSKSAGSSTSVSRKRGSDAEESERKKIRVEGSASDTAGMGVGENGKGKGKAKSLVDYGDDSDEETAPGGFVREDSPQEPPAPVDVSLPLPTTTPPPTSPVSTNSVEQPEFIPATSDPPPPPLGSLRRKAEADDEELDLLSAASKTRKVVAQSAKPISSGPIKISFGVKSGGWSSPVPPAVVDESVAKD